MRAAGELVPDPLRRGALIMAGLAVLLCGIYLFVAASQYGLGFPLDDAWIHQTYARSVASSGRWAFQEGQPSAGSTSPFWTLAQVPGQLIGLHPVLWSALVGAGLLVALAASGAFLWKRLEPSPAFPAWLPLAVLMTEWHLVWAALSGMETLAAGVFPVLIAVLLMGSTDRRMLIGVLIGVGLWIRPDLLSLLLLVIVWELSSKSPFEGRKRNLLRVAVGMAMMVVPYFALQLILSGEIWPSTFYAKQAEYQVRREIPFMLRYLEQWRAPLAGVLALLLPGTVYWVVALIRGRDWGRLALALWPAVYLATFAARLPVAYQHGRYAMPVIPLLILTGTAGWGWALNAIKSQRIRWGAVRAFGLSLAILAVTFLVLGGRAYVNDVGVIETEMVAASIWISENTDRDSLIAAHDIGALGYFGERSIVDLAGLVSPEVIPFLRDETALEEYLNARRADYLMTFPGWYPHLTAEAVRIYTTGGRVSPSIGGESMAVYRWVR